MSFSHLFNCDPVCFFSVNPSISFSSVNILITHCSGMWCSFHPDVVDFVSVGQRKVELKVSWSIIIQLYKVTSQRWIQLNQRRNTLSFFSFFLLHTHIRFSHLHMHVCVHESIKPLSQGILGHFGITSVMDAAILFMSLCIHKSFSARTVTHVIYFLGSVHFYIYRSVRCCWKTFLLPS